MARPRHKNPTPAELEVLQIIWEHGPSTVREVMGLLEPKRPRAYPPPHTYYQTFSFP